MSLRETFRKISAYDKWRSELPSHLEGFSSEELELFHRSIVACDRVQTPDNKYEKEAVIGQFAALFSEAGRAALDPNRYAKKPETFDSSSYNVHADVVTDPQDFDQSSAKPKPLIAWNEQVGTRLHVENPFVLSLVHRYSYTDVESRERKTAQDIISVLSFHPDFKHNVLLVQQLQGGNTTGTAKHYRKALGHGRERLKPSPEDVLFDRVEDIAAKMGITAIGLLKPGENKWSVVRNPSGKRRKSASGKYVHMNQGIAPLTPAERDSRKVESLYERFAKRWEEQGVAFERPDMPKYVFKALHL